MNIIVIHTLPGLAGAAASALDAMILKNFEAAVKACESDF